MTRDDGHRKLIVVTGIVTPWEWDDSDAVTAVAICEEEGREYIVRAKPAVRQLLHHIDGELEVTGVLVRDDAGDEAFVMEDFEVGDVGEDWDEEDDEDGDWDEDDAAGRRRGGNADDDSGDEDAWDEDEECDDDS